MDDLRHRAMVLAYQWRREVWLVLDALEQRFRCFIGAHEEYLRGEPLRYVIVSVSHPDGSVAE